MNDSDHEVLIRELAFQDMEYIFSSGAELYQYLMDNLETVEEMANIIVMHYHPTNNQKRIRAMMSALQQLESDMLTECLDRRREND